MEGRRGHWYLITGFFLGLAAGLVYAWLISPVHYVENAPESLSSGFKDVYRSVIAAAYVADSDIGRAESRLVLLGDPDPEQALASQAQRILAQGGSQLDARNLAILAAAVAQHLSATPTVLVVRTTSLAKTQSTLSLPSSTSATQMLLQSATATLTPGMTKIVFTATSSGQPTLTPTDLPTARTGTPLPSPTATATQGLPYALLERSQVCNQSYSQPRLQVQINDASGNPVPGLEIVVTWDGGQDHFWTGLEPEISPGFADFVMTRGVTYTLQITGGGQVVNGIAAIQCSSTAGDTFWGGWYLLFKQPQP